MIKIANCEYKNTSKHRTYYIMNYLNNEILLKFRNLNINNSNIKNIILLKLVNSNIANILKQKEKLFNNINKNPYLYSNWISFIKIEEIIGTIKSLFSLLEKLLFIMIKTIHYESEKFFILCIFLNNIFEISHSEYHFDIKKFYAQFIIRSLKSTNFMFDNSSEKTIIKFIKSRLRQIATKCNKTICKILLMEKYNQLLTFIHLEIAYFIKDYS